MRSCYTVCGQEESHSSCPPQAEDPMGYDVDSPDSSDPVLEEVEQFLAENEFSLPSFTIQGT